MSRDPDDILAARRRLLLRAEAAFGVEAVTWKDEPRPASGSHALTGRRADEDTPASPSQPRSNAKPPSPRPTPGSGVASPKPKPADDPKPTQPAINLFGVVEDDAPAPVGKPIEGDPLPTAEKQTRLRVLDDTQVKGCTKCVLHETRTNTVFGEGSPDAPIVFVGEGPGQNEDESGRPFVGRAGELLEKMLGGMGLSREEVFIANVVKCRPPNNRTPTADEVATCTPYLDTQLETIRPKAIVTLGLPASQYLLGNKKPMKSLRGQWHDWRGIPLMPTYHPAYVLRSYTKDVRQKVWSDLQMVMEKLGLEPPG